MNQTIVKFIVEGNPIPKVRTTQRAKWCKNNMRSQKYQRTVASYWMIYGKRITPALGLKGDLFINCKFFRENQKRVDLDNLTKSVLDGLKYGRAFEDDCQIKKMYCELNYDSQRPRVEIEIGEISGADNV